jgi:SPX domain protein involved in polyphosphate accumulation
MVLFKKEIGNNTRNLLLHVSKIKNDENAPCSSTTISILKTQAHALSNRSIKLNEQTRSDTLELLRIAKIADETMDVNLTLFAKQQFQKYPWKIVDECGQGIIVILLSDIHTVIRNLEIKVNENFKKDDKEWVAPTSFERVTTKYWIHENKLLQVLLNSVSELPLLVYVSITIIFFDFFVILRCFDIVPNIAPLALLKNRCCTGICIDGLFSH